MAGRWHIQTYDPDFGIKLTVQLVIMPLLFKALNIFLTGESDGKHAMEKDGQE
jgi:hypothetical protein